MTNYGGMNPHAIGIIMRELAHRAIREIRQRRFEAKVKRKLTPGKTDDVVTDVDRDTQDLIDRSLRECFPQYGIIAEERDRRVPCALSGDVHLYWTVDPIDGTKAFVRGQSHGFGPMIALIRVDELGHTQVIAACIGDANTQELFYFRPESPHVHWILPDVSPRKLGALLIKKCGIPLSGQHVLLRGSVFEYPIWLQPLLRPPCDGGLFRGSDSEGGSIGLSFSRLWKAEVGAMILKPARDTPWDLAPVLGISQQLGFEFFRANSTNGSTWNVLSAVTPVLALEPVVRDACTIVVHRTHVAELDAYFEDLRLAR